MSVVKIRHRYECRQAATAASTSQVSYFKLYRERRGPAQELETREKSERDDGEGRRKGATVRKQWGFVKFNKEEGFVSFPPFPIMEYEIIPRLKKFVLAKEEEDSTLVDEDDVQEYSEACRLSCQGACMRARNSLFAY
ncbi:hypothetical protein M9H77_03880 [Catharanthus roseus]|uniref:Uncharacterized protein n=1 Tax=Catharanthus roseus TaxID=4058 RepID=A0ACC0CCR4_CATRO|nr:hypothetical protein M9H77_03880 [Catharanthus roseus]